MFGQYFGNYLVGKNKISQSQFEDVMKQQRNARVKLGLIAVAEKLLTTKQAEEVNLLQTQMDKRFGDIAIEKGYLLSEEVTHLLNMQGNPYLKFVQCLTENNIMTLEDVELNLDDFKKENDFSETDLNSIKSGDIDQIISVFVNVDIPFYGECISLVLRNIVRFIDNQIMIKKAYTVKDYHFGNMSCQSLVGDHQIFVGLACKNKELLSIAEPYAKENFTEVDEDAFDAVCEFINCTNGLYASKLSLEGINIDMTPPLSYINKEITSQGEIYVVPVYISGAQTDLLVVVNNEVEIN